jgi:hypothetical protein
LRHVIWWKFTDVSEVLAASIIVALMEAESTSETSVNVCQTTQHNNPEDCRLRPTSCVPAYQNDKLQVGG